MAHIRAIDLRRQTQMTENEAKTKWCPMIQMRSSHCIAYDCMGWRHDACEDNEDGTFVAARHNGMVKKESGRKFIYHGHCGLAGPLSSED